MRRILTNFDMLDKEKVRFIHDLTYSRHRADTQKTRKTREQEVIVETGGNQ